MVQLPFARENESYVCMAGRFYQLIQLSETFI